MRLAIPRQTHPRTVASINPPGTLILRKKETKGASKHFGRQKMRNAVKQRKVADVMNSRSM